MTELLEDVGINVYHFSYPLSKSYDDMKREIDNLSAFLGADNSAVAEKFRALAPLRAKLALLDSLTVSGHVTGGENHTWLVSTSDFCGDSDVFEQNLDSFLLEASERRPVVPRIRLGFAGVPPIITDLYSHVRKFNADFLFNEVQRQFSIPSRDENLYRRYLDYTYPYDVFARIADIKHAVQERRLDGIVHYVQSFCHRQIQDILLRQHLPVPVLTIEANSPSALDERSKIRLESFVEMLAARGQRRLYG
jgi:benzoyl-CoA reductase/2-hydroxyglutaryl-CoA dehydratase subunit BcrC/BadD/HgdB